MWGRLAAGFESHAGSGGQLYGAGHAARRSVDQLVGAGRGEEPRVRIALPARPPDSLEAQLKPQAAGAPAASLPLSVPVPAILEAALSIRQ